MISRVYAEQLLLQCLAKGVNYRELSRCGISNSSSSSGTTGPGPTADSTSEWLTPASLNHSLENYTQPRQLQVISTLLTGHPRYISLFPVWAPLLMRIVVCLLDSDFRTFLLSNSRWAWCCCWFSCSYFCVEENRVHEWCLHHVCARRRRSFSLMFDICLRSFGDWLCACAA